MKKNISINISGIIFHIEEDGYNQLKEYLESINRYFSTFEDSLIALRSLPISKRESLKYFFPNLRMGSR
jgi:hypothetical protein